MSAISSKGFSLKAGDAATPTEVFTKVAGVTQMTSPNGTASILDITDLESTAKEKLLGLTDEGKFSFSGNYIPGNATQVALKADQVAKTLRNFKLCNAAGTAVMTFSGYVMSLEFDFGVDKPVTMKGEIEISGAVTYVL